PARRARPRHSGGDGPGAVSPGQRAQAARHLPQRRPQRHLHRRQSGSRCGPPVDRRTEAPDVPLIHPAPSARTRVRPPEHAPRTTSPAPQSKPTQAPAYWRGGGAPPPRRPPPSPGPADPAAARWTASACARGSAWTATTGLGSGLRPRGLAGQQTLALGALARQLAGPTHRLRLLAHALLRRLFVVVAQFHLAEYALALHLLLQRLQSLIDVVVADLNQQAGYLGICWVRCVA